jgi:hypothetical protein
VQFAVGFKIQGKTGHVVVDAEDALIAALKVKMQRPEALMAYVVATPVTPCADLAATTPSGDTQTTYCRVTWPNGTAC